MISATVRERYNHFPDDWSPSALLESHGFDMLVACDCVEAFGAAGQRDDAAMRVTRTDARRGGGASISHSPWAKRGCNSSARSLLAAARPSCESFDSFFACWVAAICFQICSQQSLCGLLEDCPPYGSVTACGSRRTTLNGCTARGCVWCAVGYERERRRAGNFSASFHR